MPMNDNGGAIMIFDIQRFSLHDGPGIRTTVFFKGCPLRCAWCHNPQSQRFEAEQLFRPELCVQCGRCGEGCVHGARIQVGEEYRIKALVSLLLRDRQLYETSGGGVTLSGGEPLAQDSEYMASLLGALGRRGVHRCVDTSLCGDWARIEALVPLVDLWLCDMKAFDDELHRRYTGISNAVILENLSRLSEAGAALWLRIPVVPGANGDEAEMAAMARWAREHVRAKRVCILPYHKLGQREIRFEEPSTKQMEGFAQVWREAGFTDVRIGG